MKRSKILLTVLFLLIGLGTSVAQEVGIANGSVPNVFVPPFASELDQSPALPAIELQVPPPTDDVLSEQNGLPGNFRPEAVSPRFAPAPSPILQVADTGYFGSSSYPPPVSPTPPPLPSEALPGYTSMPPVSPQTAYGNPQVPYSNSQAKPMSNTVFPNTVSPTEKLPTENAQSVSDTNHPFTHYYTLPSEQVLQQLGAAIKGQPIPLTQLLEGVRSPTARAELLATYWELAGLLAEYNMRIDTQRKMIEYSRTISTNQTVIQMIRFAELQLKSTELLFVKKQWELAEQLRVYSSSAKNRLTAETLPIPTDLPLYKKYETHYSTLAKSQKSQFVGRMIPIQEQLIGAKNNGYLAAGEVFRAISQTGTPYEACLTLQQRMTCYAELIESIVTYNKMIASYLAETVGPNVSQEQLIGALLELPKTKQPPGRQLATPPPNSGIR